jgi:hypothetical protein
MRHCHPTTATLPRPSYALVALWLLLSILYRSRGACRAFLPLLLPLAWLLAVLAFLPVMHVLLGIFDCTKVAVAVDGTGSGTETKTV